jgi:hypothetical protein
MPGETPSRHDRGEELRRRYRYRRLIVRGRLRLSHSSAVRLVGPDCAYHLYRTMHERAPEDAQRRGGGR